MVVNRPTEDPKWAEGTPPAIPDTNPPTDPGPTRRSSGYGYKERLPHESFNWIIRTLGRWADYLGRSAGGGFSSLPELIDTLEPGDAAALIPNGLRPAQTDFLPWDSEILAIATDGKYVFFADTLSAGNIRLWAYDLGEGALTGPALYAFTDAGVDLTQPVKLETNGKHTILSFSYSADRARVVVLEDLDVVNVLNGPTFASNASVEGLVAAGDRFCVTYAGTGAVNVSQIRSYNPATPTIAEISQADTIVQATNGDIIITSEGSDTIEARRFSDLTTIAVVNFGGTTEVARVAMTATDVYFVTGDQELYVISAAPFPLWSGIGETQLATGIPWGEITIDAHGDILLLPDGGSQVFLLQQSDPHRLYPYAPLAQGFNPAVDVGGIASDGAHVYIAGGVSGGDFGIWQIAKGSAPAIYRRVDPDDNDSWTRTLAAPI